MKEEDIIAQLIDEIDAATASNVGVRTDGGDADIDPPEVIIDFSSSRIDGVTGHTNLGGFTWSGSDKTGWEFHQYYLATADCIARDTDEGGVHGLLNTIQDAFSPYEYNSDWFHADTREWAIGDVAPRDNPVMEPDWFQYGVPIQFEYVRKVTKSADTLDTVNTTVDEESDTLEDGDKIIETN